ncbi:hypothetical protein LR69_01424 [Geobacillus sp. BCO2]|nr:hypothetical protein LR69_01424 [Geobacillus sp. BCO2]
MMKASQNLSTPSRLSQVIHMEDLWSPHYILRQIKRSR